MDDRKLMPCPLCGGENVEHSVYADRGNQNIVRCLDCGCRVSSQFDGCVEVWNLRPAEQRERELVEALEFYVNPQVYEPAFMDRRSDITFVAKNALAAHRTAEGEGK